MATTNRIILLRGKLPISQTGNVNTMRVVNVEVDGTLEGRFPWLGGLCATLQGPNGPDSEQATALLAAHITYISGFSTGC
jgi:hypothetical protein